MDRSGLDEMQRFKRNQIGNQCFLLLLYLLLIDAGLSGFGWRWLAYPANIMVLVTICSGIYVVRLLAANAYVGPARGEDKAVGHTILTSATAVAIALAVLFVLKNTRLVPRTGINDAAAPILLITAAVATTVALTVGILNRLQNKRGD